MVYEWGPACQWCYTHMQDGQKKQQDNHDLFHLDLSYF
jgi:hypothetical protein